MGGRIGTELDSRLFAPVRSQLRKLEKHYETGLFECCAAPGGCCLCCETVCCPCCVVGLINKNNHGPCGWCGGCLFGMCGGPVIGAGCGALFGECLKNYAIKLNEYNLDQF